jgi:cathepsin A (carboxypeptidase C)
MMENGPCRVSRDEEGRARATMNAFGWNGEANVVWVDQPSGVGFSYDASGKEEEDMMFSHDQVAENMLAFFHRWQERFPESHNGELYIFAESFGGHYAPAVGRRYFDAEKAGNAPPNLKLRGIGVGNGLTNPKVQYKYTAKFAYENTYGIQAINKEMYKNVTENYLPTCLKKIEHCNDAKDFSGENERTKGRNEDRACSPYKDSLSPFLDPCSSLIARSHFMQRRLHVLQLIPLCRIRAVGEEHLRHPKVRQF